MARAAGASAFPVGTHCGVIRVFVAAATGVPTVAVRRLSRGLNLLRPACRCGRVPDLVHSSWAPYKDARGQVSEGVCYEPGIPRGSRRRLALFWSPRPSSRTQPRGRGTDPDRCRDSVLGNTFGTRTRGEGVGSASRASILTGLGAEGRRAVPPSGRCRGINDSTRRATEI